MLPLRTFVAGLLIAVPCWAQSSGIHVVRSGDSLWELQQRYNVPWKRIQQANGLNGTVIHVGQRLRIPGAGGSSSSSTGVPSAPPPSSASSSGGSAISNLAQAKNDLRTGLSLLIQERTANPAPPAQTSQTYVVRSGDTLGAISSRFGVSLSTLRSMNGIPSSSSMIRIGQRLHINRAGHPRRLSITYHAPMQATADEVTVLARIVKGECPPHMSFEGKVAVAAVLLNRVRRTDGTFSLDRSITRAAHRSKQFSCYNPDKRASHYYGSVPAWAYTAARTALAGVDPTQGSTHYYNPYLVSPSWAKNLVAVLQLGRNGTDSHLFYRTRSNVILGNNKPTWAY